MKFLGLILLLPTFAWGNTEYAKNCLKAKEKLEMSAKIEDVDTWSSEESTNGYEEWGMNVKCVRAIENGKLIVVHIKTWGPFSEDRSSECRLYDVDTARFTGNVSWKICGK